MIILIVEAKEGVVVAHSAISRAMAEGKKAMKKIRADTNIGQCSVFNIIDPT